MKKTPESTIEYRQLFRKLDDKPGVVRVLTEPGNLGPREQRLATIIAEKVGKDEARVTIRDNMRGSTSTITCRLTRSLGATANAAVRDFTKGVGRVSGSRVRRIHV